MADGYKHLEDKPGTKTGTAPHPVNKPFGSGGAYADDAKTQVTSGGNKK